jgi:hypothetical protein
MKFLNLSYQNSALKNSALDRPTPSTLTSYTVFIQLRDIWLSHEWQMLIRQVKGKEEHRFCQTHKVSGLLWCYVHMNLYSNLDFCILSLLIAWGDQMKYHSSAGLKVEFCDVEVQSGWGYLWYRMAHKSALKKPLFVGILGFKSVSQLQTVSNSVTPV